MSRGPVNPEVKAFEDLEAMSLAVADDIAEEIQQVVSERERFSIALSGGRTPTLLYELLAAKFAGMIPWDRVHLFWGDERYVPEDHPDSNFALAMQSLISNVPLPPQNIHPIPTEIESPEKAAQMYELILRDFFSSSLVKHGEATFDLILQGMGEDGHTASLFPGNESLKEADKWVIPVIAPEGYSSRRRITLTLPVLNNSRKALFMVSGIEKSRILGSVLKDRSTVKEHYPCAMINPRESLVWYVDRDSLGND